MLYCFKGVYCPMIWIILAIVVLIVLVLIGKYNSLVRMRNKVDEAESGIDVHLNKRYDLIPNLVETVKGYAKHESGTLEKVIAARNTCLSAKGTEERDKADNMLSGTLKSLFAIAESYPDLKADSSFVNLQNQLSQIETEILNARRFYNAVARSYNDKIMVFPVNLVAGALGFRKYAYCTVSEEARQRVEVKF